MADLKEDLNFIEKIQAFSKSLGWRPVVYGGYGLDFALHKITRLHRDIDLVIYGDTPRTEAKDKLLAFLHEYSATLTVDISENDFQLIFDAKDLNDFALNLYYIETAFNPYTDINAVIKKSGEKIINDLEIFPPPQKGGLDNINVEVQDQSSHLKDILSKGGDSNPKYAQDIALLSPTE